MTITRLNPEDMHANPAFAQVVVAEGARRIVHVGGQNAVTASGEVLSADLGTQTELALRNVEKALAAAGATPDDVVRLRIYVVAGHDLSAGFAAAQRVWHGSPTALTVLVVAGLADPRFLVEIEATAVGREQ